MNQQSVVTFNSHESRSVNTRNGQRTINTFTTTEGTKFQCWDAPLSSQVFGLLNQPVTVEYETRVNGQYTNYEIRGVTTAGAAIGAAVPGLVAPAPSPNGQQAQATPAPAPQSNQGDAQAQRITRSFGVNAALKALEIAGGDQAGAEQVLKSAVELAFIPSSFAWAGPQQDKAAQTNTPAPSAPSEDLGIPVA